MNKTKSKISLLLIYLSLIVNIFATIAEVKDISNEKYYPEVLKAINEAQQSIKITLYFISFSRQYEGQVTKLLKALINAKNRGIDVEVILDQGREYSRPGELSGKNIRSYSFLRKNKIKVYYDDVKVATHAKYVIIDEQIVIVGSFNWSDNSLNKNRESAVLINSKEIAKQYLKQFLSIPRIVPKKVENAVPIPKEFLKNKNYAPHLFSNSSIQDFDLYLLVQKIAHEQKSDKILLTKEDIFTEIYKSKDLKYFENSVTKHFIKYILYDYKKEIKQIKSHKRDKKTDNLILELYPQSRDTNDYLYLSKLYWDDNWDDRLKMRAKFCMLYVLDKTDSGRNGRLFSEGIKKAAKEYYVGETIISHGLTELKRYNLINKFLYAHPDKKIPNEMVLNEFYIYSDLQKKLTKLAKKTDKEIFQAVTKIADMVHEPSDLEVHKTLIALGNRYGIKCLKDTITVIEKHPNGASPYRRFPYVAKIIESEGEGKWERSLLEFDKWKEEKKTEKGQI